MQKPVLLDLCCGKGGWAIGFLKEGWDVIGVDCVNFSSEYPGRFILADLLFWSGYWLLDPKPALIVASVPCEQFSRWAMPWTRKRNPAKPSLDLWKRAEKIAGDLGVPLIQENVGAAQKFVGKSKMNCGPFHLWGDVPALVPVFKGKKKASFDSKQRALRAMIPENLARWIARVFVPPTQGRAQ